MESTGLVRRLDADRTHAFALEPERFYATARVAVMHGKHAKLVVPEQEADLWRGVPCLDIGDLSNVVMCSVPPASKNYQQRTGRAGRRDGNALTVTVATGQPHDLFFYAEPLDMLASRVDFLIRPARAAEAPPVAIFMDGFEFHRDSTDQDSVKRMALVRAGFLVWSLTWHDLDVAFGKAAEAVDFLDEESNGGAKAGGLRRCGIEAAADE